MHRGMRGVSGLAGALLLAGAAWAGTAADLNGRWTATLKQGDVTIPFRLDLAVKGDQLVGTLYNGDDPKSTTSGRFHDGQVELNFEHYLTSIHATLKDGELDGSLVSLRERPVQVGPQGNQQYAGTEPTAAAFNRAANKSTPFHAKRYAAPAAVDTASVPSIDGVWEIPQESPKGEKAWRLVVQQKGADISTTVLRIDGDTGALTGRWQNGKFVASHFDGARPGLIEITPQQDGSLAVELTAPPRVAHLTAYRPEVARAKGLPEPSNFLTHTSVRDPNEVFAFSFPDTRGATISNTDAQFKDKVILAVVTGTWCPNCHDEAQYLVQLYSKYHARGLEIVALDFEEPDQKSSLTRVNAFIKKYGVPYPYLIAGEPSEMWDKVPQAVNLNTWPATFFIGRDGRVKAVHSGFAGTASGLYHIALKEEFNSTIERLLKQQGGTESSASIAAPATTVAAR